MTSSFFIPTIALLLFLSPALGIVFDAEGEMLQNSRPYYILPYDPNILGSGGLSWTPNNTTSSSSCPLFIKPKRYSHGTPASISTLIRPTFVPTSYPVFITFFDTNTPCNERLGWWVGRSDDQLYVHAGSSIPVPPAFRIEEADATKFEYHIKYCGAANEYRFFGKFLVKEKCEFVGFLENGLLGVTPNKPVPFRFVKAFNDIRSPVVRA